MDAALVVEAGPDRGQTYPIKQSIAKIGRGEHCELVLKDASVSTEHVEIR